MAASVGARHEPRTDLAALRAGLEGASGINDLETAPTAGTTSR